MGHVLNIDHFHMSEPTFPPHPHAGFSAITWMLPWSPGAFVNRDSQGDRSRIAPGSFHGTVAGSGMMHEEIPEAPGTDCEGLQIFVKLPEALELSPPRSFHMDDEQIPKLKKEASTVRVLLGEVEGVRSTIQEPSGTMLAQASVQGRLELVVPDGVDAFALVLRGEGRLAGQRAELHDATSLTAGPLAIEGDGLEVLIGWSARMPRMPAFRGPFCMFNEKHLADAARRFQAGEMGALTPSPVSWSR
jgi:redox-sensitive bicupin YhaK (pirin superfamily)